MYSRRHGGKPTLALWTLVVLTDVALLTNTAGPVAVLVMLAGLSLVTAAGVAGWFWLHRTGNAGTGWIWQHRSVTPAPQFRRRA